MSKQHANKQAGKNNQSQVQTRQTGTIDKDSQRKAGAKGTSVNLDNDIDADQIGNADRLSPGYQASGRFQQDHLEDDEVGNRAQNQNYDRAVHGAANSGRSMQKDESRGRMAGSKDTWNDDKSSKAQSSDKKTPVHRNFNASSKDTADKEDQRRAGSKGDTSSSKR